MNVYKIDRATLDDALAEVNRAYDGNLRFEYCEPRGSGFAFRLTVHSAYGPGSRHAAPLYLPWTGETISPEWPNARRIAAACWHAHGWLFEAILSRSPDSWIRTAMGRIDVNGGNWRDRNIGNAYAPVHYSECCECDTYSRLPDADALDEMHDAKRFPMSERVWPITSRIGEWRVTA